MYYHKLEARKISGGVQERSKGEGKIKRSLGYLEYRQTWIHVF